MFRRAASLLDFSPRDGELVEVRGRLGVYEPRGDLQLIVESMQRAGQGALFEQFLRLKAKLESEGLFDGDRKRALPVLPRGIGVVTSLGAAALHDVVTALRRRVPHIPVTLSPALVQGPSAPEDLIRALHGLYVVAEDRDGKSPPLDVILLVRGGGSIEDLWAFNDERLARTIAQSPVPLVSGVGHETDFTIADFVADLRAPTPTAAAELVAQPREVWLGALQLMADRLQDAVVRGLDTRAQRLDHAASRLGRPSGLIARQQMRLASYAQALRYAVRSRLERHRSDLVDLRDHVEAGPIDTLARARDRLAQAARVLDLLDPRLVLRRGYTWLRDDDGRTVASVENVQAGQALRATLADGEVDVTVAAKRRI